MQLHEDVYCFTSFFYISFSLQYKNLHLRKKQHQALDHTLLSIKSRLLTVLISAVPNFAPPNTSSVLCSMFLQPVRKAEIFLEDDAEDQSMYLGMHPFSSTSWGQPFLFRLLSFFRCWNKHTEEVLVLFRPKLHQQKTSPHVTL